MRLVRIGVTPQSAPGIGGGLEVEHLSGVPEALDYLAASRADAVLAVLPLGEWTAAELLLEIQRVNPLTPVLLADSGARLEDAARLARLGAWHVSGDEPRGEDLKELVEAAAEERRSRERSAGPGGGEPWRRLLVGRSRAMEEICRVIRLVGPRRATVLITGETGTGKEMAARAIHMASPRAAFPMVSVSCSALPEHLLEAELFGHVRGAFTGAIASRVGRFEQANGGTLFLDEIGDVPLELQAKLLRVLQEREFQRLGSSETVRADVRVVAATNVDLAERVRQGCFREDLFYRLNVVPLSMPALRDRPGDIPLLARHFVEKVCRAEGLAVKQIGREVLERLERQNWPGNVRQLENAVEMAVTMSGERDILYWSDFPDQAAAVRKPVARALSIAVPDEGLDFERTVSSIERSLLEQALRKSGGNKKAAADMLRLKRTTLAAKLRTFDLAAAGA
ncbi:MAG: sigma-54 dependent transcriptional regulator [Bryobacteraceae bacterium]